MKKLLLILTVILGSTVAHGQLNPIKNLYWNQWYVMPNNFFVLHWSPPDTSTADTLVGYNIYRDTALYRFYTDTIASHTLPQDTSFGGQGFVYGYPPPFYIHVIAVYNKNHLKSNYNDSALCHGASVGIEYLEKKYFTTSPNPFSEQTVLQADKFFKNTTLTVYNSYGQQVKQLKNISGQTITFHRDNLPNGLYFIRLTQDGKTFATDKLVITDN